MNIADIANPRQVILVSSRAEIKSKFSSENEVKDNIFALSWHMPVSFEPALYAIASGKERFSTKLIKESNVYCVNFMPFELRKEVLFCGRNSGENIDKFKESGFEKEECDRIDCPRIKQALGFLECEVIQEIDAGDHIIFIGKVLNSMNKGGKRIYQVKSDKFSTLQ